MKKEFHLPINASNTTKAVNILAESTELSKQAIKQAMKKGAVWIEDHQGIHRLRRADKIPSTGSTLHFYHDAAVLATEPPTPQLIADEGDYSVWYKPPGMLSQGSKWGDHCTLNRWIESHQPFAETPQRDCFIVHRLDKAARGLMLIAHKKHIAAKLAALFEQRTIEKVYRVVVEGLFPETEQIMTSEIDNKPAHSCATRIAIDTKLQRSLLSVSIKTGRKHQIRVHLSRLGYPVVGDRLHGVHTSADPINSPEENIDLQLVAWQLAFICPVTQQTRSYQPPLDLSLNL